MSKIEIEEAVPSADDIEWAARAYNDRRPLDFIASVLGVKEKAAFRLIKIFNKANRWNTAQPMMSEAREEAERAFARATEKPEKRGPGRPPRVEPAEEPKPERRRFLLSARHARHWDMIWFLRSERMSGRSLRKIYGDECLIWSVGGGIDVEIAP